MSNSDASIEDSRIDALSDPFICSGQRDRPWRIETGTFGDVALGDPFFDSLRRSYGGASFDDWFLRKHRAPAFLCIACGQLVGFLYLKIEDDHDSELGIRPTLPSKRRLKIGTLKVSLTRCGIGRQFMQIVFDTAESANIDEVYVTTFGRSAEERRLVTLLTRLSFEKCGWKTNSYGIEQVFSANVATAGRGSWRPQQQRLVTRVRGRLGSVAV